MTVSVPANAFPSNETVTLTTASPTQIVGLAPADTKTVMALGVAFSGAAPTVPITVTINNPSIPVGAKVYKIGANGQLIPVQASVVSGQATITFSADPDFIVVAPKKPTAKVPLKSFERAIVWNGSTVVVPAEVHDKTTYMPIWYVMQFLKSIGVQSKWDGKHWTMTTSASVDLTNLKPGRGPLLITLNGKNVANVPGLVAVDPTGTNKTTFVPIWYVMQVLQRLGLHSTWDGSYWTLTKK